MYLLIVTFLAIAHVEAQEITLDPAVLFDLFGTPPTPTTTDRYKFEDITVKPTESNVFTDKNEQECKCVPYYLCNNTHFGVNMNNASVTGYGVLDLRFSERKCEESTELCCTDPLNSNDVVTSKPDSPRLKGCGYRNPEGLDFKITGGQGDEAGFGEFPWVVALLNSLNGSCAGFGVLIHPQVVLTAAHKVYQYAPYAMKVRAGEWDTQTKGERLPYQERLVREIVVNEDFKQKSLSNDIAIFHLEKPFELADHINVICLPSQDENFEQSKRCAVNGWRKDTFGLKGRYAVILNKIEQDVIPHKRCEELLKKTRLGIHFRFHSSFICAGGEEGKDTCQGDGGAPLACPIGDNRYKLTGLVSWGIDCGQKNVPAMYAAVPNFRRWIDSKMAAWGYDTNGYSV